MRIMGLTRELLLGYVLSFSLIFTMNLAFGATTRSFHLVTIENNGTKMWYPSTIVVNQGDTVVLHLQTKLAAPSNVHGFSIEWYGKPEVVDEKGTIVTFVAKKAGIFPFRCQLHEAHMGGELVVLKP